MKWKIVASPNKGQSSERQSSHPATTASGRLKTVTNLELDNKAKTQPTIRKPTLAGCYSIQKGPQGVKSQHRLGWSLMIVSEFFEPLLGVIDNPVPRIGLGRKIAYMQFRPVRKRGDDHPILPGLHWPGLKPDLCN